MNETLIIHESYPVAHFSHLTLALNRKKLIERKKAQIKKTTEHNGKRININDIKLNLEFKEESREWYLVGEVEVTYNDYEQ